MIDPIAPRKLICVCNPQSSNKTRSRRLLFGFSSMIMRAIPYCFWSKVTMGATPCLSATSHRYSNIDRTQVGGRSIVGKKSWVLLSGLRNSWCKTCIDPDHWGRGCDTCIDTCHRIPSLVFSISCAIGRMVGYFKRWRASLGSRWKMILWWPILLIFLKGDLVSCNMLLISLGFSKGKSKSSYMLKLLYCVTGLQEAIIGFIHSIY